MPDTPRDGNDEQRERSESRLRSMAFDEIAKALEQVGIDIRTREGRRELRGRLDYLDRLYEMQDTNREALDWAREHAAIRPSLRSVMEWVAARMRTEEATRDAMRKTLVEKAAGGMIWLLVGGLGTAVVSLAMKGHTP